MQAIIKKVTIDREKFCSEVLLELPTGLISPLEYEGKETTFDPGGIAEGAKELYKDYLNYCMINDYEEPFDVWIDEGKHEQ